MRGILYPNMIESPQHRWAFIRKVYSIVAMQLLLTAAIIATIVSLSPIPKFFASSTAVSIPVFILLASWPVIVMIPMIWMQMWHPWNLVLLLLFSICISFSLGIICRLTEGKEMMEASALTAVIVVFFTISTFWCARRGYDFRFLWPFLFAAIVLLANSLVQVETTDYRDLLAAALFTGFIIYGTDSLIKRHSYDEYVLAAVSLYLDVVNLFMAYRGSFRLQMVKNERISDFHIK